MTFHKLGENICLIYLTKDLHPEYLKSPTNQYVKDQQFNFLMNNKIKAISQKKTQ